MHMVLRDETTRIASLEIPDYVRRIQVSKKQRDKYYEWDGTTIKSGSKKLLQKYINQEHREYIVLNHGCVSPNHLKEQYAIIEFKGDKEYRQWVSFSSKRVLQDLTEKQRDKPSKWFLCELIEDGMVTYSKIWKKVIANETQAGKPRYHIINGQDFYVGLSPFIRTKIVDTLKEMYYKTFAKAKVEVLEDFRNKISVSYPVIIEVELRDSVKNLFDRTKTGDGIRWDVGNRTDPYMKTFLDFITHGYKDADGKVLVEPLIVDDDRLHVSSGNNSIYTPIEEGETPKLIFHFYRDTRSIWTKFLNNAKTTLNKVNKARD